MINATKLKAGMIVLHKKELCQVLKKDHVTPGKGKAHVSGVFRNVKTGTSFPFRFNSDEKIERAHLEEREMEYLYDDDTQYHFMNTENYEQIAVNHDFIGEAIRYVLPNTKIKVTFFDGSPVGIDLPLNVDLKITEADAAIKNQTATTSYKKAVLETGLTVMVPPFVESGETIRVNTESGEYVERVSK
jgi:elongation factor P